MNGIAAGWLLVDDVLGNAWRSIQRFTQKQSDVWASLSYSHFVAVVAVVFVV
jgi:hypothetical protein